MELTTAERAYQEWIAEFLETIGKPDNWDDANCNERWLVETAWAQAWPVARKPLKDDLEEARELLGELQERNFINDPRPKSAIAGGGYPMSPSLRKRIATFLEGSK